MKRFQRSSMYITLLLVSMLAGFLVTLIDRGASSALTLLGIVEATGAGLATFVVSSFFPTLWILFARQSL